MGTSKKISSYILALSFFLWFFSPPPIMGQEDIQALREEIRKMREDSEKQRQRMQALEEKLQNMEAQSEQKTKAIEEKVAAQTSSWVDRFLKTQTGESRFVLTGSGFGGYQYRSKNGNQNDPLNTFRAGFMPLFLYRLNDWIFFESEVEFELEGSHTNVNLEFAQGNLVLNDYMTLGAGKFLLPFGEFIERLHPVWINKLITNPLPFREDTDEGGLLPFGQVGAQVRGGFPLGRPGRDVEYTIYVTNGPSFESKDRGAILNVNNLESKSPKAYGARIGFRPFPFDWGWGRFKVGASTYNGEWSGSHWLNVWGLDTSYQYDPFELRAEYLGFHREMFSGTRADNRNGWYLQGAYKLSSVPVRFVDRSEFIFRFSGVNSPQDPNPDQTFVKRPRQLTFGWDFWLTPSVAWKMEYDRDLPRGAGAGNQFLTQFAFGF